MTDYQASINFAMFLLICISVISLIVTFLGIMERPRVGYAISAIAGCGVFYLLLFFHS